MDRAGVMAWMYSKSDPHLASMEDLSDSASEAMDEYIDSFGKSIFSDFRKNCILYPDMDSRYPGTRRCEEQILGES